VSGSRVAARAEGGKVIRLAYLLLVEVYVDRDVHGVLVCVEGEGFRRVVMLG
jgi:hypothetical protein